MARTTTDSSQERPYRPSWLDRFTDWVERLPLPAWVFYGSLACALVLIQVLFLWLDGGLAKTQVLLPLMVFNGVSIPFLLALIHLLDRQAVTALNAMRPTMEIAEAEFDEFQYKLANMPSLAAFIAGLGVLAFYLITEQTGSTPARFAALEQLPVFAVVFHIIDKSPAFLFGPFFYHTFRQLRLVNTITSNHVRIRLFDLGPVQAFSKLTASTAIGLVFGLYGWMLINPDLLSDPVSVGFLGLFSVLAVAVFVWPLLGAHKLIEMEKQRALQEIDMRFEAVFSRFNDALGDDDYGAVERLNGMIASLEIQQRRIASIPTWPWRPETAQWALAAIALPLILTVLQLLAGRVLGW